MVRLRRTIDVLLLGVALVALVAGASIFLLHLRLQPVLSGSMRPGIQPGDLAVMRPVSTRELQTGDVIAFYPPHARTHVMHRLVSIDRDVDGTWVTTQGDANDAPDPWGRIRLGGDTADRLVAVVPKVGFLPVWARSARGPVLIGAGLLLGLSVIRSARRSLGTARVARPAERGFR
jgi:signal peptidase